MYDLTSEEKAVLKYRYIDCPANLYQAIKKENYYNDHYLLIKITLEVKSHLDIPKMIFINNLTVVIESLIKFNANKLGLPILEKNKKEGIRIIRYKTDKDTVYFLGLKEFCKKAGLNFFGLLEKLRRKTTKSDYKVETIHKIINASTYADFKKVY